MLRDVTPYFENTTMQAYYNNDGMLLSYRIHAADGYVIHDKETDAPILDPDTLEETGEIMLGYCYQLSVGFNYDFEANPREIYAVPENEVPADSIFGSTEQETETI